MGGKLHNEELQWAGHVAGIVETQVVGRKN